MRHAPVAQLAQLLELFTDVLVTQYLPLFQATESKLEKKKRRKLEKGYVKSSTLEISIASVASAQVVCFLLACIVRVLPDAPLAIGGDDPFGLVERLLNLGRSFVLPALEQTYLSTRQEVRCARYALLQLHSEIVAKCRIYWRTFCQTSDQLTYWTGELASIDATHDPRACLALVGDMTGSVLCTYILEY
jgi:hypothetical protein